MAPKRLGKKSSPTSASEITTDTPSKPSRVAWKTGEQLEYLLSHWGNFVTHQNEKGLDRFWPRVYDGWYKKWPITPSPELVKEHGSRENAILTLRSENNGRIRSWFHNHGRPSSRPTKSDLRLSQNEKRKLAPVQAYCAYAWDEGLRDTVITRWEEQKLIHVSADDDDPVADSIETPSSGSHIPIDFKLKVAREIYNSLSPEEKKRINDRREEDRKKMYRTISEITSVEERDKKLLEHKKNQPSVAKSVTRILKNLEDQAGCVAHLFVGYVDPQTGKTTFQNHCQGKTDSGLEFDDYCGDEWESLIEKRFRDWALSIFGERGTSKRSTFTVSNPSPNERGATTAASNSRTSCAAVVGELPGCLPGIDTSVTGGDEVAKESSGTNLPNISETMQVVPPYTSIPPSLVDQPSATTPQIPDDDLEIHMVPRVFGTTVPRGIFSPPQSLEPARIHTFNVSSTVAEFPVTAPAASGSSHRVTSSQVVSSVVHKPPCLVTPPVLESSQIVTSNQTAISPIIVPLLESSQVVSPDRTERSTFIHEPTHLVTPILESSQATLLDHATHSAVVHELAHLVTPVLESSQAVPSGQVIVAPIARKPPSLVNPTIVGPIHPVAPQQVTDPPHVTHEPRPAAAPGSPDLVGDATGGDSGATVTTKGVYRLRDKVSATTANRTRRDSIEGTPDVILSLGGSGYEFVNPSLQQEPPIRFVENDDVSIPPSTAPSPAPSSIVPSSQQSLEEYLTIPTDVVDLTPPSEHIVEELLSAALPSEPATVASGRFPSAPREIPTYDIDRSDFPSWLLERGRLDYVLSVEAGELWEKLITVWLRQERRLAFGLNEQFGADLSLKEKPSILKDYFKWHHNPSKGDSVTLPEFGDEVSLWWSGIQPKWRYKEEHSSNARNDYSYILAGGKKGVFLLILCLAWWDRAHGRGMEEEKSRRRKVARTAGTDEAAIDFSDLHDHEYKWFNIVNDLIFVMELAQGWPVPGELTPGVAPARRKRGAGQSESSSPRKKKK